MNVFEAIDAGHVASDLTSLGAPTKASICRKDEQPWPCPAIEAARAEAEKQRMADRGSKKSTTTQTTKREHY